MSSKIFTPVNQVKLTNVSVVRLKKGGQRFELACYKNKVAEYRNRITRDLDEILQSRIVFSNVSKGQAAKDTDIKTVFGANTTIDSIIEEILQKGEVQVGSEERGQALQMLNREIATIVADKCLNPVTKVPYPLGMIEQALREIHFAPTLAKNAKQQALDAIRLLVDPSRQAHFPIARAQMKLLVATPANLNPEEILGNLAIVKEELTKLAEGNYRLTCLADPGQFRPICDAIAIASRGKGSVQVLSLKDLRESSDSVNKII